MISALPITPAAAPRNAAADGVESAASYRTTRIPVLPPSVTLAMLSHCPVLDMARRPVELREGPVGHWYSELRNTRRPLADHSALSHPLQPSRSLGRRMAVASTCSRVVALLAG